jgi:H+-translocating NAD(P) transhydrogenase subunit alpha
MFARRNVGLAVSALVATLAAAVVAQTTRPAGSPPAPAPSGVRPAATQPTSPRPRPTPRPTPPGARPPRPTTTLPANRSTPSGPTAPLETGRGKTQLGAGAILDQAEPTPPAGPAAGQSKSAAESDKESLDFMSMLFVFMLATFIGIGVIRRVSRLLHTPLMSLTNAISAIAVVGSIMVPGGEKYPTSIRILGAIALFASMTNIVSGFLITDRMLKMFKTRPEGKP